IERFHIDCTFRYHLEVLHHGDRIALDREIGFNGMDRLGLKWMSRPVGRLLGEPYCDLRRRAPAGERQFAAIEFVFDPALNGIRLLPQHCIDKRRDAGATLSLEGGEGIESFAESLRPPEMMPQPPAPALRHFKPVEQRMEKLQIAQLHAIVPKTRRFDG